MSQISNSITNSILNWINTSVQNKKGKRDNLGRLKCTLTPFYKWFGITLFFLISLLIILIPKNSDSDFYIAFSLFVFFGGISLILVLTYFRLNFVMDDKQINSRNFFYSSEILRWEEVKSIKFNHFSTSIIFKNKNGKKVKAHAHLHGISEILEMIEKKKGLTKQDIKFPY